MITEIIILNIFFFVLFATAQIFLGSMTFKNYLANIFSQTFVKSFYPLIYVFLTALIASPLFYTFNQVPEHIIIFDLS